MSDLSMKKQVEEVLRDLPAARNSDITLMLELWRRFYPEKVHTRYEGEVAVSEYVYTRDLYDLPREDHIKRIRAVFQNEKMMYLPTDLAVVRQRKINEEKWREALGYPPPQGYSFKRQ